MIPPSPFSLFLFEAYNSTSFAAARRHSRGAFLSDMLKRMARIKLIVILMVLLAPRSAEPAGAAGAIEVYQGSLKQPGISLQDIEGERHSLADFRGKVVLVNFWATWCIPCVTEMPGIQRLADSLRDKPFAIFAINVSDTESQIREFLRRMNLRLTVLVDHNGDTFRAWEGKVLPVSFLLDHAGEVRYQVIGPMEWDSEHARKIVEELMHER
jgi:thiol-disulfide isomerase/thioredoxin